jgi:periplasmic protein TonB
MSYADTTRRQNPGSLIAAIALNGAIIAAVALSPMVGNPPEEPGRTNTFNVPKKTLPPPDKPIDKPVDPRPFEPIFTPKPFIEHLQPDDSISMTDDPPPEFAGPTEGTGKGGSEGIEQQTEALLPPVFTKAKRDMRFAAAFQPDYPSTLLVREIEGSATIRVLVGTDGRVREAMVVSATHPDFGKAAMRQALKAWLFKPATRGKEPVEDWVTIPITFKIT